MTWEKLNEESTDFKYRKIIKKTFKLPNGLIKDFFIKEEKNIACILAITKDKKVILLKQYRPGPEKELIDLPGGMIDEGETSLQAAKRELLEETGYTGELNEIGTNLECAYSSRIKYGFVATNCEKIKEQKLDDSEFCEVMLMPLEEFRELIKTESMADTDTCYRGLDFLNLL